MKKNVAGQVIGAQMISTAIGATGLAFTGPVMVYITGDNGSMAVAAGAASATHKGWGYHAYGPTQGETNYAHVAYTFATTNASPHTVQVYTTFPQTGDAYVSITAFATAMTASVNAVATAVDSIVMATDLTVLMAADAAILSVVNTVSDDVLRVVPRMLATVIESNMSVIKAFRLMTGAHGGKTSGMDTGNIAIRDVNDTKTRITATADASGNRSAVTLDLDP